MTKYLPHLALGIATALPLSAQAATFDVVSMSAFTSISTAIPSPEDEDVYDESYDADKALDKEGDDGAVSSTKQSGARYETSWSNHYAYQDDNLISRAKVESDLIGGEAGPETVTATAMTSVKLKVSNDTDAWEQVNYNFSISGMALELVNTFGIGPNPLLGDYFGSFGDGDYGAEAFTTMDVNNASGGSAVRLEFAIYDQSALIEHDFLSFYDYGAGSLYYGAVEMWQSANVDSDGSAVPYWTVTEASGGLSYTQTVMCGETDGTVPPFCYGSRVDVDDYSGSVDLGLFDPGREDYLLVVMRVTSFTHSTEQYALARIGDPSDLSSTGLGGGVSASSVGVSAVPVPAAGLLLLGGLGGLAALRRRRS